MEQFNIPHQKIREKSVYLVHLDVPRIVLISAAVIGIIIASFLLGMNFVRGGDGAKTLMTSTDIFDSRKELDILKGNLPGHPDEEELTRSADEKLFSLEKLDAPARDVKEDKTVSPIADSPDLLTKENIGAPVPAEKETVKKPSPSSVAKKKEPREKDSSYAKGKTTRPSHKKAAAKRSSASNVVAVSADTKRAQGEGRFSVQVASYDTMQRATNEVGELKRMDYDAYVDETRVNGKRYYRVRVGQIGSQKKALNLLDEIQGIYKYRESYMVRE